MRTARGQSTTKSVKVWPDVAVPEVLAERRAFIREQGHIKHEWALGGPGLEAALGL